MEHKTIAYLNSRVWYRFSKVVFLFIGLLSILIFNGLTIASGHTVNGIDNNKTEIYCNYWSKANFTPTSIGVYLSLAAYYFYSTGGVDDGKYQTISKNCAGDHAADYDWGSTLMPVVPVGTSIFSIKPAYTYNTPDLKLLAMGNIGILFILEIVRRTFYYIVLGRLNPKKL